MGEGASVFGSPILNVGEATIENAAAFPDRLCACMQDDITGSVHACRMI